MLPGGTVAPSHRARTASCAMRRAGSRSSAPSHCNLLRRTSPQKSNVVVCSLPSSWWSLPVVVECTKQHPAFQARVVVGWPVRRPKASLPCLAIVTMLVLCARALESAQRQGECSTTKGFPPIRMAWSVVVSCSWKEPEHLKNGTLTSGAPSTHTSSASVAANSLHRACPAARHAPPARRRERQTALPHRLLGSGRVQRP